MLVPAVPLAAMIALLYAVTLLQPPFDAARSAIIRDVIDKESYPLAMAINATTVHVVVVVGSAVGGLVVALFGARPALGVDALTFIASALLIQFGVHARPASASSSASPNPLGQLTQGVRLVFGDRQLRLLIGLAWLAAFYVVPEGIAAPYAGSLKGGATAAGLILATSGLGAALITPLFTKRIGPLTRLKWMGPMAVLACVVLTATAFRPNLIVSMALFAVSNCFAMYQIAANTRVRGADPERETGAGVRPRQCGPSSRTRAGIRHSWSGRRVCLPSTVSSGCGIGALIACGLAIRWRGMSPVIGRHTARHLGREASLTRQTPIRSGSL